MDLTTMTPSEIDALINDAAEGIARAERTYMSNVDSLRYALGQRPSRDGRGGTGFWRAAIAETLTAAEQWIAEGRRPVVRYAGKYEISDHVAEVTAAEEAIRVAVEALKPLNGEYARRGGWTRFYLVDGGHIHSSANCKTCHRNGKQTRMGIVVEMSGMDEGEALTSLGRAGHILCTVCFPNAPLDPAWAAARAAKHCTGKTPVEGTVHWPYGRFKTAYGDCPDCGESRVVKLDGTLKAHPPKK